MQVHLHDNASHAFPRSGRTQHYFDILSHTTHIDNHKIVHSVHNPIIVTVCMIQLLSHDDSRHTHTHTHTHTHAHAQTCNPREHTCTHLHTHTHAHTHQQRTTVQCNQCNAVSSCHTDVTHPHIHRYVPYAWVGVRVLNDAMPAHYTHHCHVLSYTPCHNCVLDVFLMCEIAKLQISNFVF